MSHLSRRDIPWKERLNKRWGKVLLTFLLASLCLSLDACIIVTYRPHPVTLEPASKREGLINFFYYAGGTPDPKAEQTALSVEFQVLQRLLEEQGGFAAAIVSSTPPAKGTYLTVYRTINDSSKVSRFFCTLSTLTLTVFPCYANKPSTVQMNLYVDNDLKKSYQYEIVGKHAQWLGFLPLFWVNGLMTHYRHAFEATVYQFILDGRRDGYL